MRRGLGLLGLALALGACSLAGDLTPPPGLATAQAQGFGSVPTATPLVVPDRSPDLANGALIFADRCAPCHGETGGGDGVQSSDLPNPPTPLRQIDVAQRAVPAEWYRVVTVGRFDRFMPGFASLDDGQRWDVVGYALSLGLSDEAVVEGSALFQAECAECHGSAGAGEPRGLEDFRSASFQASRSWLALYGTVTNGVGEAMPSFAAALTDDERWAVAAFVRSLGLPRPGAVALGPPPTSAAGTPPPTPDEVPATTAQPAPTVEVAVGVVRGRVRNGTAGSPVPGGIEVVLHGLDGGAEVLTETARPGSDGAFAFTGVEIVPGRRYAVTTVYQDVLYASDIAAFAGSEAIDLLLTVFETSPETEAVRVGRLHLLFEVPAEGVLQVVELWLLSNLSDRTVVDQVSGAIEVDLPAGASGLSLDGGVIGERFVLTETGFRDRRELVPGENTGELVFSYNLPYRRRLDFARPVLYPVTSVIAMVTAGGPTLSGEGLVDGGLREVAGASLHSYSLGPVAAGDRIEVTIRGGAGGADGVPWGPVALGVGALALALIGAGLIWFRPRRTPPAAGAPSSDPDAVLWAIASLDNDFDAGRLAPEEYRQRRRELIRRYQDESPRD